MKKIFSIFNIILLVPFIGFAQWNYGSGGAIYYNGGNVGIGASSPSYNLEIVKSSTASIGITRTGTSAGSIIGSIYSDYKGATNLGLFVESNFDMHFDTPSSRGYNFNINSARAFTILGSGRIGIGTSTPTSGLSISKANSDASIEITRTGTSAGSITSNIYSAYLGATNLGLFVESNYDIHLNPSGSRGVGIGVSLPSEKLDVSGNIKCVDLIETSDRRSKNNIKEDYNSYENIYKLKTYRYTIEGDNSHRERIGLMAQDLLEVYPEFVYGDEETGYGVSYTKLVPVLIRALQDQNQTISTLQEQVNRLSEEISNTTGLKSAFSIYPNPTDDAINISISKMDLSSKIELLNLNGEKMIDEDVNGRNSIKLSVSNLSSGVYFVRLVNSSGGVETQRIVIE